MHQKSPVVLASWREHFLFDYSPDMGNREIVSPANFKSMDMAPVCEVPWI